MRRGFTLLEVLITVSIIAVAAVIVIPGLVDDTRVRLMAASSIVTSDIEFAQVMTISYPDTPLVVRFDPDAERYWIAYADDAETPMNRPDTGEPYLIELGVGRASSAAGVTLSVSNMTNDLIEFNSQGGLAEFPTEPSVTLALGGEQIVLSVAATTGTVTESE